LIHIGADTRLSAGRQSTAPYTCRRLRTGEVRHLSLADIDWERRKLRIDQSKGMNNRFVYLSQAAAGALREYVDVRGVAQGRCDQVFLYRHQPLGSRYCAIRLNTYGSRCGVSITPHQLRHSCATMLLNAGAPVVTVQSILGHKRIDTTLRYARLYDGTISADYYEAMAKIEARMEMELQTEPVTANQDVLGLIQAIESSQFYANQQIMLNEPNPYSCLYLFRLLRYLIVLESFNYLQ
jgi:hypothetical protein